MSAPSPAMAGLQPRPLVEVLDQVLDSGVVIDGQIVLSVAGVDLVHLGLRALLASVDTAARASIMPPSRPPRHPPG